jgi:hypothetical protein
MYLVCTVIWTFHPLLKERKFVMTLCVGVCVCVYVDLHTHLMVVGSQNIF